MESLLDLEILMGTSCLPFCCMSGSILSYRSEEDCADRYDVELFQKIEALTGQKMEKFEAEQDAALVLLDGVNEAQRIATMQVHICSPPKQWRQKIEHLASHCSRRLYKPNFKFKFKPKFKSKVSQNWSRCT